MDGMKHFIFVAEDGNYAVVKHDGNLSIKISGTEPIAVSPEQAKEALDFATTHQDKALFDPNTNSFSVSDSV